MHARGEEADDARYGRECLQGTSRTPSPTGAVIIGRVWEHARYRKEKDMKLFKWQVTVDGQTVIVTAPDKLMATKEAARLLRLRWSEKAREMFVVKMGEVKA